MSRCSPIYDQLLEWLENILIAHLRGDNLSFSVNIQSFKFFGGNNRLPFLRDDRPCEAKTDKVLSFELLCDPPNSYIILKRIQKFSRIESCLEHVRPRTREYLAECIRRGKYILLEEW